MKHPRKEKFVSMRMSDELYKWLKDKANKVHRSVSWVIRKYLEERQDIEQDILH